MPTLMVSVSGVRGIIGNGLDPQTIIKYTSDYADFCGKGKIVLGELKCFHQHALHGKYLKGFFYNH